MLSPQRRASLRKPTNYVLCLLTVGAALGWWQRDFLRGYAQGSSTELNAILAENPHPESIGMIRFTYDDFGGLNTDALQTHATPWKVVSAALVLDRARQDGSTVEELTLDHLNALLGEFGFIVPEAIGNWRGDVPPRPFRRPLGIISGQLTRSVPRIELEVANLGCTACHAGVTYDKDGNPTRTVWLGLPNTSIDLEAFTTSAYESLKSTVRFPGRLLAAIQSLYPDVSERELRTIERLLLPRIEQRLRELEATIDAPAPYSNGSPGLTNGVGALKWTMGLLEGDAREQEVAFTSIPDLGGVALRSSLLYDGTYAVPGKPRFVPIELEDVSDDHIRHLAEIVSFFTVPIMGVTPKIAERSIPRVTETLRFVASYESPRFPGAVDPDLASEGGAVYRAQCAHCHGVHSLASGAARLLSFPNRHVPQAEMGTDSARWQPDSALFSVFLETEFADHIAAAATGGYVATRLTGLWATAPYLHNGSVPTLWHLMHPEERPKRFYVGGHRLDFEKLGVDGALSTGGVYLYPAGYRPWATPQLYDTTQPGRSNAGHEREFATLTEEQKRALLEYLKLL